MMLFVRKPPLVEDKNAIGLYGQKRLEAFEMCCWRKMLSISWQEHRTNDSILTELGLERELIGRVAKLKLQYFGHITRASAGQLALTVLEGIMEGLRHQGRPPTLIEEGRLVSESEYSSIHITTLCFKKKFTPRTFMIMV